MRLVSCVIARSNPQNLPMHTFQSHKNIIILRNYSSRHLTPVSDCLVIDITFTSVLFPVCSLESATYFTSLLHNLRNSSRLCMFAARRLDSSLLSPRQLQREPYCLLLPSLIILCAVIDGKCRQTDRLGRLYHLSAKP